MPRKPTAGYIVMRDNYPLNAFWLKGVLLLGRFDHAGHIFATRKDAERAINNTFKDYEAGGAVWDVCTIVRLVAEPPTP